MKSDINLEEHPGELCSRTCQNGIFRTCYYKFHIEFYQAMGVACNNCTTGRADDCNNPECVVGDGTRRGFMAINRQLPGPPMQVCLGDYIVVDVINSAPGTATTMHWHGLHMRETEFMDGAPFVTQCPIPFGTQFRYQFEAKEVGAYFYHSLSGLHQANGLYGILIIRQPVGNNPHAGLFDFDLLEHHLVISDMSHHYAEFLYPGMQGQRNKPDAVLLNGRGTFMNNNSRMRETSPPPHVFYVKPGGRYRFRTIAAHSFTCLMQLQVESHTMNVVATDGRGLEPIQANTIILNAGERYDFVIKTNQTAGDYWMRLRGLGVCGGDSLTEAFALLRYTVESTEAPIPSFPSYDDTYPEGTVFSYPHQICNDLKHDSCAKNLQASEVFADVRDAKPDLKFYIGFNNYALKPTQVFDTGRYDHLRDLVADQLVVSAINNVTFIEPSSPLLSQPKDIDDSLFCDENHLPENCSNIEFACPCVHRLKAPLSAIVEMLLVDENEAATLVHHSIHLHSYHFLVTDSGQRPKQFSRPLFKEMYEQGELPRGNFNESPPRKDTVSVPAHGYVVIRFKADNPGYWLLYSQYDFQRTTGMALVLQVGEKSDMPKPPADFPKCGNYLPKIN